MRPDITFKEQVEMLRAVDQSRVRPGRDFSWPFESFQSELTHEQSYLFEWFGPAGATSSELKGFVLCRASVLGEGEIMHMACALPGAGAQLMQAWFAWAKKFGIQKVFLEFHHQNLAAQRLYETLGFKKIAQRPRYYRDGGDAVLMSIDL